jgi:hypothetical protein
MTVGKGEATEGVLLAGGSEGKGLVVDSPGEASGVPCVGLMVKTGGAGGPCVGLRVKTGGAGGPAVGLRVKTGGAGGATSVAPGLEAGGGGAELGACSGVGEATGGITAVSTTLVSVGSGKMVCVSEMVWVAVITGLWGALRVLLCPHERNTTTIRRMTKTTPQTALAAR